MRNNRPPPPTHEPDLGNLPHEVGRGRPGGEQAEQRGISEQHQGRSRPDRHQHHLALKVVADLDLFLVLVGGLVDVVVAVRLEEEVTGLARGHRDQPADQCGDDRVDEQPDIGEEKAQRADEVQALVDAAVVIVAMVVPALDPQLLEIILDHALPQNAFGYGITGIRCRPCDIIILSCDDVQRRDDARDA
ncbi:hypothetical protein ACVIG9_008293 [Bradyrhizobium ottawaense]